MKALTCTIFLIVNAFSYAQTQTVNAYARVSVITTSGGSNMLTVVSVNESGDSFEDGDAVIVMQMQDDVIGGTSNDVSFGLLGSIATAGQYQIAFIESHIESGGIPTQITIQSLAPAFSTGINSRLQIISYPTLGSPDYTAGALSAPDWDGETGGVLAFQVMGVLTLGSDINLDGAGFLGADADRGGTAGCNATTFIRLDNGSYGAKGEGIFYRTSNNQEAGRARILTGGGGGNPNNAGGGGGSNFTAGGEGGPGWACSATPGGGLGGIPLSTQVAADRVFLGGGGGSGEGNNNNATGGGDGGGIILIAAEEIITTGSCAGRTISANGESVIAGSSNDGSGGAGGAGSIVLEVEIWTVAVTCPVTVSADGGAGGSVTSPNSFGGGGGGGQGAVIFSVPSAPANVTPTTIPGLGGDNSSDPITHGTAEDGGGTPGDGIIFSASGPLPIVLIDFNAVVEDESVRLNWITEVEVNNWYFTVERTLDGSNWEEVFIKEGAGNSTERISYEGSDDAPLEGISLYRLKQTDFSGAISCSKMIPVEFNSDKIQSELYPNPAKQIFTIRTDRESEDALIYLFNSMGQKIPFEVEFRNENIVRIRLSGYENGIHTVLLQGQGYELIHRVMMLQ
ncbi:MAG: hypothetical protein ACI959_000417 [Limisphaerales bacterium]|jgi:hypothetical protein